MFTHAEAVECDKRIHLRAKLIFDKWQRHYPYDSVGLSEWWWDVCVVWDVLPT